MSRQIATTVFCETGPLCSMACLLTRARMVSVCSAVTESCNSDKSEVIAARPECLPITMRWERPSNPGSSAW